MLRNHERYLSGEIDYYELNRLNTEIDATALASSIGSLTDRPKDTSVVDSGRRGWREYLTSEVLKEGLQLALFFSLSVLFVVRGEAPAAALFGMGAGCCWCLLVAKIGMTRHGRT